MLQEWKNENAKRDPFYDWAAARAW